MTNTIDNEEIDTVLDDDYLHFLADDKNPGEIVKIILKKEEEDGYSD